MSASRAVSTPAAGRAVAQGGYTYLMLLILVALLGLGLASVATVWQTMSQRDKERELLFVGQQFRLAIASYQEQTPTGANRFPTRLDQLLSDNRFPTVRRHLRRIYTDPMTGKAEWGLVKTGEAIIGVHSLSTERPLKTSGFPSGLEHFGTAQDYRGWSFAFAANPAVAGVPGAPMPGSAGLPAGAPATAGENMPVPGAMPAMPAPSGNPSTLPGSR